ncbi:MAG: hypothetical protein M3119_10825 [Verrucomicrobiota bacterium]|nr:hypothetical protein [Verrucomicrobiota bacterium]
MIAVTFALPNESSDFVRRLTNGRLHGEEVRVLHTGVGERAATKCLATFFEKNSPRLLISSGFAGALTDELRPGDIFIAENFAAPALLNSYHGGHMGRLQTIETILDSLGERSALAHRTGAMAVDMETKFIAQACREAKVPMLSLRAISDSPSAPFPIPPSMLFDLERQRTRHGPLAFHLLKHPTSVGKLLSFAKQIAIARRSLTNALEEAIHACSRSGGL